ncbi:GapR family DNA-binding domain-containing protein [Microvirga massiliensis]|uniref:GapR family DNA-binding domain-containing protein n=1 Tax=Microvirga massiliensis TaxID=1033741 RepID=UPI00062BCB21|nr:GapR family DNA-binding domain-containing protein [Microvirga massiliensis]
MTKATPATISKDDTAADLLRSFVDRLVVLYRERETVSRHIKENRREGRPTDALRKELQAIGTDVGNVLAEAQRLGFTRKAVEIVAAETMETLAQRRKREELELVVDLYRQALGLKNDHGRG